MKQPQITDSYDAVAATPEEREEIARRIERAVEEHHTELRPDSLRPTPRKRDAILPILVNVAGIVLLLAGGYVLVELFRTEEVALVADLSHISSAEGRLLSELRRESQERLSSKEAEIARVENQLNDARSELARLRAASQRRFQNLEERLVSEAEAEMEGERERLADQPLSAEDRAARMAEFRALRRARLERDLEVLESQIDAEIAGEEETLRERISEYEARLAAAGEERAATASLPAPADEGDDAQRRLAELSADRETAQLILDQLVELYGRIRSLMIDEDYAEAGRQVAALRSYLESGPITRVAELSKRREIELYLVGVLEAQLANRHFAQRARAIDEETEALVRRLRDELSASTARVEAAEAQLEAARERLSGGGELDQQLGAYRAAFENRSRDMQEATPLELLEAKLEILRIVSSQPVRNEFPDLYDSLNGFFDTLADAERTTAVRAALGELRRLLREISGDAEPNGIDEIADAYPTLSSPDLAADTARILETVRSAFEASDPRVAKP